MNEAPENGREVFMNAALDFIRLDGNERQIFLEILQNNDFHTIFAACMQEDIVIRAFNCASARHDFDLLQAFHDIGMNMNAKDRLGTNALLNASGNEREESVRWLLDHDANVDIQDNYGTTPLMCASENGGVVVVEMLLQKNANPDIQNNNGRTALMLACRNSHKEIVQMLLNHSVDVDLKSNSGKTALDFAMDEEIKEMLRNHVPNSYVLK